MDWKARVSAAFGDKGRPDDDVIEELAQHAADAFHTARASGRDESAALADVDRQVASWAGDPAALRRRARREAEPVPPASTGWTGLLQDVRFAVRLLRRQPGYTLTAVATMALGIGATTVVFSVLHSVLLKPLPWPAGDRLVRISETRQRGTNRLVGIVTNATYRALAEHSTALEAVGGWTSGTVTLGGAGDPARIESAPVTASLLSLLGARARLGTLFTERDEQPGGAPPVVISSGLWRERFGSASSVIGRTITLDGERCRIAGVMAESFSFPSDETKAWIPFYVPPVVKNSLSMFRAIGRLRPDRTAAQATAEGTTLARNGGDIGMVAVAVFGSSGPTDVAVVPYLESQTKEVRPAILVLFAAVGLLLVTATANVASLQLARAATRRREIALRAALGAGGRRLVRQFLVENVLVGLAGGLAGLAIAVVMHRALPSLLPAGFPRLGEISINMTVLAVAAGASILTGILFGLLPALQARRVDLVASLAEGALAPVGFGLRTHTARARALIMTGQVAVACVLLLGALLLARSFRALWLADRGYDPKNVLTASLPLPDASYTGARRADLLSNLLDRLQALPGVRSAAIATVLPLTPGDLLASFRMPSPRGDGMIDAHAAIRQVSPGYFAALGVRVAEGRAFTDADSLTSAPVVIVNRSFASQYLVGRPVGQSLPSSFSHGDQAEIVGVVEDVHHRGVNDATQPEIYVSYRQLNGGVEHDAPRIILRTAASPTPLVPALRTLVRELDPTTALDDVRTMEDRVSRSLAQPRLYAVLLGVFAAFALAVAAVGLFGVLSYGVAQRSREIGIRAALGARPASLVGLVVRQGLGMAVGGTLVGLALSFVLVKYLSTLLYGVTVYDAWSYAVVVAVLLGAATIACAVPARRAARVDPLQALRSA
jgi:predicted permease